MAQAPAASSATRFAGSWSYPTNGSYHGAAPEIFEMLVREESGRLTGSVAARFQGLAQNQALRFVFSGVVRPGRNQVFNLQTSDGATGTIELIPGNAPMLLEVTFQTQPRGGKAQAGNMILVKR